MMLCVAIALCTFACKKDSSSSSDEEETTEETALFDNGLFTEFSKSSDGTVTYPAAPTSWTGTPGSSSASKDVKTPQDSSDLSAGVISVGKSDYSQSKYGVANPGKPYQEADDKILMINNKTATAYSYVSTSTTIEKNTYYKLSFYLKTANLAAKNAGDEYGAYIYVKGNAYVAWEAQKSNEDWTQYVVYFKGSNTEDKTITLSLGLGEGALDTGHMVTGYAFFDQVVLEDLTNVEEGQTAYTDADYAAQEVNATTAKYDLGAIDGNFNYATLNKAPLFNPSQLTGSVGKGSGTDASTGSTYLEKGILDMALAENSKVFSGYSTTAQTLSKVNESDMGSKVVMINNKAETAYTYKDNLGMLIENKKFYKISIYARTYVDADPNVYGANIALNNSSDELVAFESVKTNQQWVKYTFYVEGNQYSDNTLFISMSLGIGGSGDGKWTKGAALFDNLTYEQLADDFDFAGVTETDTVKKYTYASEETDGSIVDLISASDVYTFKSTQYEQSFIDLAYSEIKVDKNASVFTKVDPSVKLDLLTITNKKLTSSSYSTIYKKDNTEEADETNKELLKVNPNTAYSISFWVKSKDLSDGGAGSIELFSYDEEKQASYDDCKSVILTLSSINESTFESYKNEDFDDFTLITMYVLGDTVDTKYLGLNIKLGTSETASQSASFVKGSILLTNLRMQEVSYDTYSGASTGTTVLKYSFVGTSTSGEVSSNGTFSFVDMSSTKTLYNNSRYDAETYKNYDAAGKLITTAVPTNWTITNSTALKQNGGQSTAGVIDVLNFNDNDPNYPKQTTDYVTTPANIYENMGANLDLEKCPNVLLIDSVSNESLGYKSTTISLNANSYYMFSVYGKKISGTGIAFSVMQSGETDYEPSTLVSTVADTDWHQYIIYVRTGISSASVTVSLYAGSPTYDIATNAQAMFTMATYTSITKDIYDAVEETANVSKKLAWFTDTMYLTSSTATDKALASSATWTGASIDSNASTDSEDLAKGIFNQLNSNWEIISIDPDETDSFKNKIFADDSHGDSVLVIDNKTAGSYGYTSTSFTMAKTYYKISIFVLTKDLAYLKEADIDKTESKYDGFKEKNIYDTATITLTVNNKTYTFGKNVEKDKTKDDFAGETQEEDWAEYQLAKSRLVNNSDAWQEYTYYISLDEDIEEDVSATVKISVGGKSVSYWEKGYLFADNFTVEEIEQADYDAGVEGAATYKIAYTNEDAKADPEEDEEEEENNGSNSESKNWLWLYITSGIIGGILVIILTIYIIRKYAPKKKIKKSKKTLTSDNSSRGKFGE